MQVFSIYTNQTVKLRISKFYVNFLSQTEVCKTLTSDNFIPTLYLKINAIGEKGNNF